MQKTILANYSSFLVWSGKGYHLWMWSLWGSQQPFSCVTTTRPNDQLSDPSLSLLLNREKAVFCNMMYNLSSYSYLCQVFCHNTRLSCVLWVFNQSRALSAIPGLLKCLLMVALSLKKPFQPTDYRSFIRSWFISNIDLPSVRLSVRMSDFNFNLIVWFGHKIKCVTDEVCFLRGQESLSVFYLSIFRQNVSTCKVRTSKPSSGILSLDYHKVPIIGSTISWNPRDCQTSRG